MKTFLYIIGLSLISFAPLQSQELEKSLLWEISGNGLKESSYLYGTIHITCDASLDDNIKKALDNTSLLVLELDMDDPKMQMEMMGTMMMKDGKHLKDLVTADEYQIIGNFIKEQLGMPVEALGTVKPFFLSAMLYPKLLECPMQSFEAALMEVANTQNEEILGLETVQEQMNLFNDIPYEDQAKDLLRSAKDQMAYDKASFKRMLDIYSEKDIEALNEYMLNDENIITTEHRDKMLDNRNKNWIPKIIEFAKEQRVFFGFGAGHLPGENGVINLLRKEGYTVKAVM